MAAPAASSPKALDVTPSPATRPAGRHRRLNSWTAKAIDVWYALQITHYGGKYSIERMLALEEYIRDTSFARVLVVIFGTPLPTLVLVLCQESIPLQDPTDGWSANYGFWIRMGILGFGEACATSIQLRYLLDGIALTFWQTVLTGIIVSVVHTGAAMLVAAYWVFPVPFVNFVLSSILFMVLVATFRVMLGRKRFQYVLSQQGGLRQCALFLSVQTLMVSIYPAYQFLFDTAAHTSYEFKLVLRNIFTFTVWQNEDTIPEQVIFTVDFFDAFYLAMCVQTSSSTTTIVVIMTVDFIQSVVDLFELHQRTRGIMTRVGNASGINDFLGAVRSRCHLTDAPQQLKLEGIQVRSCIFHEVSAEGRTLLTSIAAIQKVDSLNSSMMLSRSLVHAISRVTLTSRRLTALLSSKTIVVPTKRVVPGNTNSEHRGPNKECIEDKKATSTSPSVLHDSLEALFTTECLVLTEYLETFVPVVYATFILVMAHLPSAQYHAEMEGVTIENVGSRVRNVFIYATLEMASFVALAVIIWRNCGMRALHHLAFVLETQQELVQSKLILWVLMILTYRVVHFGTFQWRNPGLALVNLLTQRCSL